MKHYLNAAQAASFLSLSSRLKMTFRLRRPGSGKGSFLFPRIPPPRAPFYGIPIQIYIMRAFWSALGQPWSAYGLTNLPLILLCFLAIFGSGQAGQPILLYIYTCVCMRIITACDFLSLHFSFIENTPDQPDQSCFYYGFGLTKWADHG